MCGFVRFLAFSVTLFNVFHCDKLGTEADPVNTMKIYDGALIKAGNVMGESVYEISDYEGYPTATFSVPVAKHNFKIEQDKVTLQVWPLLTVNNVVYMREITAVVKLNEASTGHSNLQFYQIDINSIPSVDYKNTPGLEVVYYQRMDEKEREEDAFVCTFVDNPGFGKIDDSDITHLATEKKLKELVYPDAGTTAVKFNELELVKKKENQKDPTLEEKYGCSFRFSYEGQEVEFGREFTVTFDPKERTNWGGIVVAICAAVILFFILVAFIICRCCCVRRKKTKEKPIPPEPTVIRNPVQETNLSPPESHPKFHDAVNFLDRVQERFEKAPDIYRAFLNTLTEYRSKNISRTDLAGKVEVLFQGHPDLVDAFNEFLKSKGKNQAAENEYTVVDVLQVTKNPAAIDSDKEIITDLAASPEFHPLAESPPESHPKFNAATQFVDQVQTRFADQPEVYKTFLKMLNDFKPKKLSKSDLRAEVKILFDGHPDLIEGFNDFISSKKKKSEPESEVIVVDMQGGKRTAKNGGEVHVNVASKGEVDIEL